MIASDPLVITLEDLEPSKNTLKIQCSYGPSHTVITGGLPPGDSGVISSRPRRAPQVEGLVDALAQERADAEGLRDEAAATVRTRTYHVHQDLH